MIKCFGKFSKRQTENSKQTNSKQTNSKQTNSKQTDSKQTNRKRKLLEVKKVTDFPRPGSSLIYLKGKEAEKEDTVKNCQKTSDTDIKSEIIMSIPALKAISVAGSYMTKGQIYIKQN